ncbi:Cyclin-like domain-containing protein [Entamoeba marina]
MSWVVSKHQLDSILSNFGDVSLGYKQRMEYAKLIKLIGSKLDFPEQMSSLAILFFMRYFMKNPLDECNVNYLLVSSIFLSMKLEDCRNASLDDLKKCCSQIIPNFGRVYEKDIMLHERKLLVGINFQLNVETPQMALKQLIAKFDSPIDVHNTAWKLTNDMMLSHVCLTIPPFILAVVAFCLSAKQHNFDLEFDCEIIREKCVEMKIPIPGHSLEKNGKCHLIVFFEVKNEVVEEVLIALRSVRESKK